MAVEREFLRGIFSQNFFFVFWVAFLIWGLVWLQVESKKDNIIHFHTLLYNIIHFKTMSDNLN
jgi:hypothetical protein